MNPALFRDDCEVAVIGAGPYGLAVAAHLKAAAIATRVFGQPMSFWRDNMPRGMRLQSPRAPATSQIPRADFRSTRLRTSTGTLPFQSRCRSSNSCAMANGSSVRRCPISTPAR